jgi:hypothetical protein
MRIVATFHDARLGHYAATLAAAEALLDDPHELIHKAVGWLLREVGKRDLTAECRFLDRHAVEMPRTMLRYAVARFPPPLRSRYMGRRAARLVPGSLVADRARSAPLGRPPPRAHLRLQILERPRPVVFEQPRQGAIRKELAGRLAGRRVVRRTRRARRDRAIGR